MDLPAEAETEKAPRIVWAPQSGPQKALIDCPLGLIGFGGARGGGKTDGVLGKYAIKEAEYGSNFNAVFFRKEMPQQDDLIERAKEIYMPTGARWFDQKKMFLLPHGGRVRFRPLETVADAEKYQGQSLCVAIGTLIRMADGTLKPIEHVNVGDMVATLEGPRSVTKTTAPYVAPCVEALVLDPDGNEIGRQVHPIWHPVLTPSGLFSNVESNAQRTFPKLDVQSRCQAASGEACIVPLKSVEHVNRECPAWLSFEEAKKIYCKASSDGNREFRRPLTLSVPVVLCERYLPSMSKRRQACRAASILSCAQRKSAEQSLDSAEETQTISKDFAKLPLQSWEHPYSGEARGLVEEVVYGRMAMREIGDSWVTDLTVEKANHYITDTGLVNKNTDAAVEEAGNYETAAPIDRLFGCLRSKAGVPIQLILTFNPGGPGNDWIRERFVTPYPPGSKRLVQRLRNGNAFEYTFIRSFVANNKILLQNDPGYVDRLHLVGSDALVKAWLEGDFNQIESAYFSEFGDRHIIPPFPDGPPEHWSRIVGFDWGFDHPFATIFGAVSSGRDDVGREVPYPKGALIIYREICGRRMYNADIAKQILNSGETWDKIAADPSIWAERGGPSIAREFELEGLFVRPADNDRRSGWSQIRRRLATKPPFLYVVSSCTNLIRSLSTLRHSLRDSEDAEKSNGDDPADALRYLCKEYLIESDYKERAPTMGQGKVWVSNYVNSVRNERQRVKI